MCILRNNSELQNLNSKCENYLFERVKFNVQHSELRTQCFELGLTLVELVIAIALIGIAVAAILLVINYTTRNSADPMVRKQALAIAESLLEEVELQSFTYCDPDDANVLTATGAFVGAGGCLATVEALGPEAETRYSSAAPFDNVNDYHNFDTNTAPSGIRDITGAQIGGSALGSYRATVSVTQQALGTIPAAESLRITVNVTGPGNTSITLDGYRTRYAPNGTP